jgi:hypothetical protein
MKRPEPIKKMLDKIRKAIAETATEMAGEKEVLEELVCEAEGWKMRLDEIEAEEEDAGK